MQRSDIRSNAALSKIAALVSELDAVDRRQAVSLIAKSCRDWDELIRLDIPIKDEMLRYSRLSSAPKR